MTQKMITIIGPTASGKTTLAAHLAASFIADGQPAEIISGDSRQVYRGMDIGTGKDLKDYVVASPPALPRREGAGAHTAITNNQSSLTDPHLPSGSLPTVEGAGGVTATPLSQSSLIDSPSSSGSLPTVEGAGGGTATPLSQSSLIDSSSSSGSLPTGEGGGRGLIPYHLIDICDPGEKYNIFQFQQDFLKAYEDITSRGALPILCGGSGLYVESVIRGYHLSPVPKNEALRAEMEKKTMPELTEILMDLKARNNSDMHNKTDVDSPQRAIRAIEIETYNLEHKTEDRYFPPLDTIIVGVDIPRDERRRKISSRLKARIDEGMVDEIKRILASGVSADDLIYYGLEYKYVTEYVIGKRSYDDMLQHLEIAIHQFAKRQMTWFRGMERRGCKIHWINALLPMEEKVKAIREL